MGYWKKSLIDLFIIAVLFAIALAYHFYIPANVTNLHQEIVASQAGTYRPGLSSKLEQLFTFGMPKKLDNPPTYWNLFLGHQRKYTNQAFKQATREINLAEVPSTEIRVWSFFNMGAVVKSGNKIIAFDIADLPLSGVQKELANLADIFLVTHADSDHYDSGLLDRAIRQGKKVVLLENFGYRENKQNVRAVKNAQTINVDGVQITAYQTDHRGNGSFAEANAWFLVNVNGFKILHNGDGRNFLHPVEKDELGRQNAIDIFLVNNQTHPYNIRDINPKVAVPMHLFKYLHNHEELKKSTFTAVKAVYNQYPEDLSGIEIKWLFPGESFRYEML